MKKIKFYIKFILQICFLISIFNEIHANNEQKYYEDDKISKYLSGVLSLMSAIEENPSATNS